ncbi:type IX secretion system anionic LPS delivery protein PorZ [Neptunitalea lumnitzerae]|uniref:ABC transporter substrate-binding protein n=1 Tax=Neptunitalea lumnitzerae TaxID=2965509 RepID=A0ABQ5MMZ5_9FLAO|nr:two-component regulator propeller domain-containing protein [Neptunitalea sp. Y10]GLB50773.1 ABC transporter substrate-binding protein [Neptunitalea sp. Y10]
MKQIFTIFAFLLVAVVSAQDWEGTWKPYFSYNKVMDISDGGDLLYVATENAFFKVDKSTLEMQTYSTVDGLSGGSVVSGYYSDYADAYVLGYEDGLLQVYENGINEVTSVVEIRNKVTIPGDSKAINNIMEYNGYVYLSCGFGISVYDLVNLEFDDTYFLGANGSQLNVSQTAVYQGYLYAATSEGVYRAMISNDNIIDFANWELVTTGNWTGIVVNQGTLVGTYNNRLYSYNGSSFVQEAIVWQINELRASDGYVLVTRDARMYVYNADLDFEFSLLNTDLPEYATVTYTSSFYEDGLLYLGTEEHGLLVLSYPDVENVLQLLPDGPYFNNAFSVNMVSRNLWITFGEYTNQYNPTPNNQRGISVYKPPTEEWLQIPYDSLLGSRNLSNITYSRNQVNEVFISSYIDGIVKVRNEGDEITRYDETNSPLDYVVYTDNPNNTSDVRVLGSAFDDEDNLWIANGYTNNAIKVLRENDTWSSYSVEEVIGDPFSDLGYKEMVIASNGFKFVTTSAHGVLGFYENSGSPSVKLLEQGDGSGNLPSNDVRALAFDNNNLLWIGTTRGLRVLYNISGFFTNDVEASQIVILENGEASELLYQQWINDIFVDGANNKWISTADSGAFYISSDGQETIYHFTTENSPMPSNNVNQIVVSEDTGEVFFATDRGIVSFEGVATGGRETLSDVYAYPNPVRPEYSGMVTITNLTDNSRVKITDIAGNLVFDTVAQGGTVQWNLTAFNNHNVVSGVYMVLVSSEDGEEVEATKIMVVR